MQEIVEKIKAQLAPDAESPLAKLCDLTTGTVQSFGATRNTLPGSHHGRRASRPNLRSPMYSTSTSSTWTTWTARICGKASRSSPRPFVAREKHTDVCMYVYWYSYLWLYLYICICMCVLVCMCSYLYLCLHLYLYVWMYVCMYVNLVNLCTCVCVHVRFACLDRVSTSWVSFSHPNRPSLKQTGP